MAAQPGICREPSVSGAERRPRRFTFDVKAFVSVHVRAETEADARVHIDEYLADALEGVRVDEASAVGPTIFVNSVSLDGEHELIEIDGEAT